MALSSGEAEYYGLVKGASMALGIESLSRDLGIIYGGTIKVRTDASAAVGIACRIGVGKVRHIEVNQLWLQEKVYEGRITLEKISTEDNLADALTKPVDGKHLEWHVEECGGIISRDRHALMPRVVKEDMEEEW